MRLAAEPLRFAPFFEFGWDCVNTEHKSDKEIIGIQYLRGIAAIGVVCDHTAAMASLNKYFGTVFLKGFLSSGALGVALFFVISGFVISIACLYEGTLQPKLNFREYIRKRFIRIVPMMWLAVLSYACMRLVGRAGHYDLLPYIRGLFPLIPGEVAPLNIWTLRQEGIFYALFAVTFLAARPKPALLAVWAIAPFAYAWLALPDQGGSFWEQFFLMLANPANIEFLAGLLIGIYFLKAKKRLCINTPINAYWLLLALFVSYMEIGFRWAINLRGVQNAIWSTGITSVIVFFAVHVVCKDGVLRRIGLILGNASYAIYLFHPHFVSALLGVWAHFFKATPIGLVVTATATAATCCCIAIHYMVEKPLIRFTKRLLRPPVAVPHPQTI